MERFIFFKVITENAKTITEITKNPKSTFFIFRNVQCIQGAHYGISSCGVFKAKNQLYSNEITFFENWSNGELSKFGIILVINGFKN